MPIFDTVAKNMAAETMGTQENVPDIQVRLGARTLHSHATKLGNPRTSRRCVCVYVCVCMRCALTCMCRCATWTRQVLTVYFNADMLAGAGQGVQPGQGAHDP